jgi:Zn-dependent M16 (insulinase) family peptidase
VLSEEELGIEKKNEGFTTAGQVQYVAQTGSFTEQGFAYPGALAILKTILSYDYLWMNLRVKGGAYGCMSGFKYNGESYFVSYRDPHLHRTLEVYKGIPDYIRSFDADEQEMTRYIIGTMSSKDIPRTPQMQAAISRTAYFGGMKEEDLQKIRDQILGGGADDIRALAPLVEAVLSDHQICVLGAEKAVGEASDVLDEIKGLL